MKKPMKWVEKYPQGTKAGDEEYIFFKCLARHYKYDWRSVSALVKETGLSQKRVEEILQKYYHLGMIFNNPKNEDKWGYWERVPEMLKDEDKSLAQEDHKKRVDDHLGDTWTIADTGSSNDDEEEEDSDLDDD